MKLIVKARAERGVFLCTGFFLFGAGKPVIWRMEK